jgi:hypothetical protein
MSYRPRMVENSVPREIPESAVREQSWRCVVCAETKRVADDYTGRFPTAKGRKGGPSKVLLTECRDCREMRENGRGGDGSPPPWNSGYEDALRGWPGTCNSTELETFPSVTLLRAGESAPEEDEDEIGELHNEGAIVYSRHRIRERDGRLRARKLDEVRGRFGSLACEACGVEIEAIYGTSDGAVYECHHLVPLHASGPRQTALADVVLLFPTCHRAAHRTQPSPTLRQMSAWHE